MRKANYGKIASTYDKGRSLSQPNTDRWLALISRFAGAPKGARVLDLGCGTGRFAIPMAARLAFRVIGADSSQDMLAKAREKDGGRLVTWDRQDAEALTYPDGSFDVCFMSHLLHHVDCPPKVIAECRRVLAAPGSVIVRYGAIEQIRRDVEHVMFPEALAIDEQRIPTVSAVEAWLADAGLSGIVTEEIVQQTYETAAAHLEAIAVKSTSVLNALRKSSRP
jgi:ubiquinone/menaquinone biosynthesis C-methylase UbiE